MFERAEGKILEGRLAEPQRFIQLLRGPRQVGKTTLFRQVLACHPGPSRYAAADGIPQQAAGWLAEQWELARIGLRRSRSSRSGRKWGGGDPHRQTGIVALPFPPRMFLGGPGGIVSKDGRTTSGRRKHDHPCPLSRSSREGRLDDRVGEVVWQGDSPAGVEPQTHSLEYRFDERPFRTVAKTS